MCIRLTKMRKTVIIDFEYLQDIPEIFREGRLVLVTSQLSQLKFKDLCINTIRKRWVKLTGS